MITVNRNGCAKTTVRIPLFYLSFSTLFSIIARSLQPAFLFPCTFCKQLKRIFKPHDKSVFFCRASRKKNSVHKFFLSLVFLLLPFFQQYIDFFLRLPADFFRTPLLPHHLVIQASNPLIHASFRGFSAPLSFPPAFYTKKDNNVCSRTCCLFIVYSILITPKTALYKAHSDLFTFYSCIFKKDFMK